MQDLKIARQAVIDKLSDSMDRDNATEMVDALVPRCDQCRFWTRRNAEDDDCWQVGEPAGTPEWTAEYERWGVCAMTEMRGNGEPRIATTLAKADDHHEYRTLLITAEAFGCVLFEGK